ncbi:C40 family peptidase [Neisseria sp. CP9]|jgi:nlpC/P60 family protein|uniref:C40 family peptidase n=1 Tax=unclassified Neisseria TaxID=2623750 RepID=UPI00313A2E1E
MKPIIRTALTAAIILPLASCGLFSGKHHPKTKTHTTARTVQPVRIGNIDRTQGSQELMLHSMGLVGTPYRWGGSSTATGFDCSGMIQFVYKNALGVSLPRTARDMAAASRKIPDNQLKAGDLVFFNTGGSSQYSHVGLYIGNGEFIHAPSSGKTIKTEKLSSPYYAKHYLGAHTFFTE